MADTIDDATVKKFAALFEGRTDAWGSVNGGSNKEPVTLEHYRAHLEGKTSLGVYMLHDDGTCNFFAIDFDEKDWPKALAIRNAFHEQGINAYIALSKGKGYHIYVFAEKNKPFVAAEVRRLSHGLLAKLNIQCEVFPKQDMLDEQTPLGNYINLPCFGSNSRVFTTASAAMMLLKDAVGKIQRVSNEKVSLAYQNLPEPPKPTVVKAKKGSKSAKSKNPQCIDGLLKGVAAGSRDQAAFALGRYYLDQNYIEEEILSLLQHWDANNRPPLNDPHLLQTKIQSAAKGYGFGCGSIKDDSLLSGLCPGEDQCVWLKEQTADRKKKGLIREDSFVETETHLYEEVIYDGTVQFAAYEMDSGNVTYVERVEFPSHTVVPVMGQELTEGVIKLPTGTAEYESTVALKNDIKKLISDYVDIPDISNLEYSAWYVLLTWVYDKLNTLSYLRFLGDTGCGKSRALDVIGNICYKPLMMAGAVTPAPIYREIKRFRGTLILEEADFKDTSEKGEVTTILNCGIERGRAVLRCSSEDPNTIEVLPCFGPKLFATRYTFIDKALEARCITTKMEETDRTDIPPILGKTYTERAAEMRNKLLQWRFEHRQAINPDIIETIDLGELEPRLKQMGLPVAIPFHNLPDVMADFRTFMQARQEDIILERAETDEGQIVTAILRLALADGKQWISSKTISAYLSSDDDTATTAMTSHQVGSKLTSLNVKRKKLRKPGEKRQDYYLVWDDKLITKLVRRYVPDPEEFEDILVDPSGIDMEV